MTALECKENVIDMQPIISGFANIVADSVAINEQMFFTYDDCDASVNIMVYLKPYKSFLKRMSIAFGYLFNAWWMFGGSWEMFTFNKDEAERLIAFLKKVQ
jgi:hypothetical protein